MGRKKKFIDKKKSATFQLLARDSSDPNFDGSPGSDRVFVRVDNSSYSVDRFFAGDEPHGDDNDPNSIFADAPEDYGDGEDDDRACQNHAAQSQSLPEHARKEILELGFPDDGYNYLAHLREIKNTGGGSAFYHNPKAKLNQLSRDVKVSFLCVLLFGLSENRRNVIVMSNVAFLCFVFSCLVSRKIGENHRD